jgi:thermitase
MLKKLIFLVLAFFLLLLPNPTDAAPPYDFSSEEIIVKFKSSVSDEQAERISKNFGTRISQRLLLPQTFTLRVPTGQVERFVQIFGKSPFVEYAEPNFIAEALNPFTPNDPGFVNQWGMTKVKGPEAWDLATGSSLLKIAILDTGIDKDHEDLVGKVDVWKNFTSSSTGDDLYGHGTHVAGIAAAATNNGVGVAGLGFNSHLLSVKVLNDSGSGYYSWVANGIKWAADNGAKVINLSLGGRSASTTLKNAIDYAWSKGVVLSCAAGNSGNKSPTYPAYYKNCIAVAATDENDQKGSFSSYGTWVEVAAPGVNIYSTWKDNIYKYGSGTSMATPHVSGLAGLLFGTDPTLTGSEVRSLIENNADKISGTGTYWTKGRINAYESVAAIPGIALPSPTPTPTPSPSPSPSPTPSPSPSPSPSPTPTPWRCVIWPWLCQ